MKHCRMIQEDTIEHDSESLCAASRVKDHQCRRIVDEIVHARKSHRLTPPSMVETGVLLEIGHTSKNVHELLCATGIASSKKTAHHKLVQSAAALSNDLAQQIREEAAEGQKLFLVLLDNYNYLHWQRHLRTDVPRSAKRS